MVYPAPSPPKMVKLFSPNITIQDYHERGSKNLFPTLPSCPNPDCRAQKTMWRNGFYVRCVVTGTQLYEIKIQRLRCRYCGISVSLIPNFALPRFQYSLDIIIAALYMRVSMALTLLATAQKLTPPHPGYSPSSGLVGFYERRLKSHKSMMIMHAESLGRRVSSDSDWLLCCLPSTEPASEFSLSYFHANQVPLLAKIS